MFHKHDPSGYRQAVDGVLMKTLVYGRNTLMTEFLLKAGHTLPRHAHAQEQTGYLVSGSIRLWIACSTRALMGAKPVPPATMMMGLAASSRR